MFVVQKKLLCRFTESEREERSQLLASLLTEYDETDESRKDRAKGFRDRLKALRKQIRAAVDAVRAGGEERDVECRVFFNQPVPATKRTVRMDTGDVVSDVAMTELELQENLFRPGELEQMYEGGAPPEPPKTEGDQPGAES